MKKYNVLTDDNLKIFYDDSEFVFHNYKALEHYFFKEMYIPIYSFSKDYSFTTRLNRLDVAVIQLTNEDFYYLEKILWHGKKDYLLLYKFSTKRRGFSRLTYDHYTEFVANGYTDRAHLDENYYIPSVAKNYQCNLNEIITFIEIDDKNSCVWGCYTTQKVISSYNVPYKFFTLFPFLGCPTVVSSCLPTSSVVKNVLLPITVLCDKTYFRWCDRGWREDAYCVNWSEIQTDSVVKNGLKSALENFYNGVENEYRKNIVFAPLDSLNQGSQNLYPYRYIFTIDNNKDIFTGGKFKDFFLSNVYTGEYRFSKYLLANIYVKIDEEMVSLLTLYYLQRDEALKNEDVNLIWKTNNIYMTRDVTFYDVGFNEVKYTLLHPLITTDAVLDKTVDWWNQNGATWSAGYNNNYLKTHPYEQTNKANSQTMDKALESLPPFWGQGLLPDWMKNMFNNISGTANNALNNFLTPIWGLIHRGAQGLKDLTSGFENSWNNDIEWKMDVRASMAEQITAGHQGVETLSINHDISKYYKTHIYNDEYFRVNILRTNNFPYIFDKSTVISVQPRLPVWGDNNYLISAQYDIFSNGHIVNSKIHYQMLILLDNFNYFKLHGDFLASYIQRNQPYRYYFIIPKILSGIRLCYVILNEEIQKNTRFQTSTFKKDGVLYTSYIPNYFVIKETEDIDYNLSFFISYEYPTDNGTLTHYGTVCQIENGSFISKKRSSCIGTENNPVKLDFSDVMIENNTFQGYTLHLNSNIVCYYSLQQCFKDCVINFYNDNPKIYVPIADGYTFYAITLETRGNNKTMNIILSDEYNQEYNFYLVKIICEKLCIHFLRDVKLGKDNFYNLFVADNKDIEIINSNTDNLPINIVIEDSFLYSAVTCLNKVTFIGDFNISFVNGTGTILHNYENIIFNGKVTGWPKNN